jgi:phage gpG-like protein
MGAPFTISIEWTWGGKTGGEEIFRAANDEFLRRIRDKSGLFRNLAYKVFAPHVAANFDSEGGEVGGWDKLARSTILQRIKEGYGEGPILQRTGKLKASYEEGGAGHIEEFLPDTGFWGTEVEDDRGLGYSAYHQGGYVGTRSSLPARRMLFMTEEMKTEAEAIVAEFVREAAYGIYETTQEVMSLAT